jgi:type I restriction enzyme S subunit
MSVPKLRFPEFRDAGEWEEKKLGEIASPVSEKSKGKDKEIALTLSAEYGIVSQGDYFGKRIAGENVDRYIKISLNDFVYNDRITKSSTYGTIKRLSQYTSGLVSPIYKCFRFKDSENPVFWEWYFESGNHEIPLQQLVNEGARAGRFNISIQKFLSIAVYSPESSEQQKIADCLSSLDDRITLETQKLDTLKAHKKGLMQQLFPAEGETLPKLRFPEFSEKWREISLGGISDSISSGKDKNDSDGKYDLYGSTGIIGKTLSDTYKGKFLLVARVGANAGFLTMTNGTFGVTDNTLVVCLKKIVNLDFIYYYLESLSLNKLVFGSGQPLITGGQLKALHLFLPDYPEQQKIAGCLTSIDEAIAAQSQAIDLLKLHKKGLMQQLFPSVEEVNR